ncbi:hypothetical protein PTKIN_Ptkin17bG0009400 [Pterospermum kingtungense]
MASRAILRRNRFISDYLNASPHSVQAIQCLGRPTQKLESRGYISNVDHPSQDSNHVKKLDVNSLAKQGLLGFSGSGYFSSGGQGISVLGLGGSTRFQFNSLSSARLMSYSVRHASTATAKQPETGSDDERNEELIAKKRIEASAEECDQAVEGLSTAKAKVKAKRLQDSKKVAKSILQSVWAKILGIGPALRAVASMSREDWAKKLVHWKHEIWSTLQHYWLGLKLLGADVRISSRLLLKLAGGKSLSRRERQQLTRTTADIFRLVPFAVFIVVPFMEFLLPVFLKLFPNMLPSTFQDKMKEQEALKRKLHARIEYAKFLQDTVKEMAKEVQNSRSGEVKQTAEDLDKFLNRIRRGAGVSNDEILRFAKLFNDELTLDNISRPRLVNMCKYMGISPFGTDAYFRYMLRKRLQWIKNDDKLIQAEGVESLSEAELRQECRERGMLGVLSVEEMRQQLRDWLDLSLNHSVPSSLLILSRAFTVSGKMKPEEAVQATLSSLPDEVVDTVGVTALPSEDSVSERRRKLDYLEMQEELIKEEEEREEEELARMRESKASEEDVALKERTIPTAREAQEQAMARALEKREQLCEISRALAVLASASSVSREREEFLGLVNKEIEFYNSMVEKEGTDGEKEAVAAAAIYLKDTLGKEGVQELISNLSKDRDGKILVEDIVKLGTQTEDNNSA